MTKVNALLTIKIVDELLIKSNKNFIKRTNFTLFYNRAIHFLQVFKSLFYASVSVEVYLFPVSNTGKGGVEHLSVESTLLILFLLKILHSPFIM